MRKYNYLLITSDQQRFDTLGCRNPLIKTPNLDKLAARGICFDRAYTSNPVCTPARISLLTGHYPSKHGCYTIGTSLKKGYDTVAQQFSDAGYFTALLGKAHFQSCLSSDSEEAIPFIMNRDYYRSWDGPYYGFEKAQLVIGHSVERHCPGMHYGVWLEEKGVDPSLYFGKNKYTDFGTWELPEEYSGSAFVWEKTRDAIEETMKQDKPFFIWSSFQDPHNPCFVGKKWINMYRPEDMPVYSYEEQEMEDKPPFYEKMVKTGSFGLEAEMNGKNWHCVSNQPDMGKTEKREIMRCYYGMITQMDHYIGKIVDYLEEKKILNNTIIIFTSDHGDYMGNHGMWWKGIPAYEDIQRVPMIVSHPECKTPGRVSESIQSTLDIPLTFAKNAGLCVQGMQGKDEINTWLDSSARIRQETLIEFRPSESDFMQITMVTDTYKLVLYHTEGMGELYDLKADPQQHHNLWNRKEYQELRYRLMERYIRAQMERDGVLQTRFAPA